MRKVHITGEKAVFLAVLFICAGCSADYGWNDGTITVRIPLAEARRYALPMDEPAQEHVDYYEAVFREHGADQYYLGSAFAGDSYLLVSVPSGKRYDILVLAGTPVNGNAATGVKVLLASGYEDDNGAGCLIDYTRTTIEVRMSLHKTRDRFYEEAGAFIYKPKISGLKALLTAQNPSKPLIAGSSAYVIPSPDPYAHPHLFPQVTDVVSDSDAGTLELTIPDIKLADLAPDADYGCYYNLTYYAFGDQNSRSGSWDIRRGVVNGFAQPFGGAILVRRGGNSVFYVHKTGSDSNSGETETDPFQSLAKAVFSLRASPNTMGTIYVLGELNWASESVHTLGSAYQESDSVFAIPDTRSGGAGTFIKIIGKTDAAGVLPVLRGIAGKRVLYLAGPDAAVQLENIEITGGNSGPNAGGGGIYIGPGGDVILGNLAKITANHCEGVVTDTVHDANAVKAGGGILVNGGRLTVAAGAEIAGNWSPYAVSSAGPNGAGGGAAVIRGGVIEMSGGFIGNNRAKWGAGVYVIEGSFMMSGGVIGESLDGSIPGNAGYGGANTGYGGGVAVWNAGRFEMTGGIIRKNTVQSSGNQRSGGAGVWVAGTFQMSGTARIVENDNTSPHDGGGVKVYGGRFTLTAVPGSGLEIAGNTRQGSPNNVHVSGGSFRLNGTPYPNGVYGPFGPY